VPAADVWPSPTAHIQIRQGMVNGTAGPRRGDADLDAEATERDDPERREDEALGDDARGLVV